MSVFFLEHPVWNSLNTVLCIFFLGNYTYSYESGDGTQQQQQGYLKVYDANHTEEVAQGSYSYKGDDGQVVSLSYVADANGYQPQGDSIPVGPPVPPLIAKALAYLATQPPSEEDQAWRTGSFTY